MVISDLDRAALKATTLWAVAIVRVEHRDSYVEDGERHRVISERVDEIEWCLDEDHADRRVRELRRTLKRIVTVRKVEMRLAARLAAGIAHELCERMSVAWAERAAMTRGEP